MVDADDARISDETLIGRVTAGDLSACERLVKRHQAAVFRFGGAAAPGECEAEEILWETFLAARRVAARHRHEPSARPWLLALARPGIDRRHPRRPARRAPRRAPPPPRAVAPSVAARPGPAGDRPAPPRPRGGLDAVPRAGPGRRR